MDPRRAKSAPGAIELNRHFGAETDLLNLQCTFAISTVNLTRPVNICVVNADDFL